VDLTLRQVTKLLTIYLNWGDKNVAPIFYKRLRKEGFDIIIKTKKRYIK